MWDSTRGSSMSSMWHSVKLCDNLDKCIHMTSLACGAWWWSNMHIICMKVKSKSMSEECPDMNQFMIPKCTMLSNKCLEFLNHECSRGSFWASRQRCLRLGIYTFRKVWETNPTCKLIIHMHSNHNDTKFSETHIEDVWTCMNDLFKYVACLSC